MTVAGVIALAALAATVASLGYLHLAPTGLSPIRNAVSQYGITPFRAGYRAATIAFAVAGASIGNQLIAARAAAKIASRAITALAREPAARSIPTASAAPATANAIVAAR